MSGGEFEKIGMTRSLQVLPGDKVYAEVYAKYVRPEEAWQLHGAVANLVNALLTGGSSPGIVDGPAYGTNTNNFPFEVPSPSADDNEAYTGPKAFLNYIFINKDWDLNNLQLNAVKVSAAPRETGQNIEHEKLMLEFEATEAGFLYVFLSNDNEEVEEEVFFDDFLVRHEQSVIQSSQDYYPFGLQFNSYTRENSIRNKYLFNKGSELQTDLDLGWYSTPFRMYDPAIGRFTQIDPMADFFTGINPYSFAFDNPVLFGDPDGLGPLDWLKRLFRGHLGDGASRQARRSQRNNHATGVTRGPRSRGSQNSNNSSSTPTPQPQVLIALGSGPTRQEEKREPDPVRRDDTDQDRKSGLRKLRKKERSITPK